MADYTIFGRCMRTTALISSVPAAVACPLSAQGCSCPSATSFSVAFQQSPSLRGHQSSSLHYIRKRSRDAPDSCWAIAARPGGSLSLLSSAGIVDQNERLKDAAKVGDLQTLNEILGFSGVSIDLPSSSRAGWTALHLACFYDHPSIVESLLKAGANLEVRNESGNTPLQLASLKGNIDIAQMLLESGADFYAESSDKGTALEYAQEWGGEDIVDFLLLWAARSSQKL